MSLCRKPSKTFLYFISTKRGVISVNNGGQTYSISSSSSLNVATRRTCVSFLSKNGVQVCLKIYSAVAACFKNLLISVNCASLVGLYTTKSSFDHARQQCWLLLLLKLTLESNYVYDLTAHGLWQSKTRLLVANSSSLIRWNCMVTQALFIFTMNFSILKVCVTQYCSPRRRRAQHFYRDFHRDLVLASRYEVDSNS